MKTTDEGEIFSDKRVDGWEGLCLAMTGNASERREEH